MEPQILIAGLFFSLGVLSMLGADFIIYLEEKKRRDLRIARRKRRTRLYHYDLNKKMHLPDGNQKRRA